MVVYTFTSSQMESGKGLLKLQKKKKSLNKFEIICICAYYLISFVNYLVPDIICVTF